MARKNAAVTTIDYSGPFFEKDPTKTFGENLMVMLERMGEEGQSDVQAQIGALSMPYSTGWTRAHVLGHVVGTRSGKHWTRTAVVSVPTQTSGLSKKEAIARNAAKASIENRAHVFRKTKNRLIRSKRINTDELLKGVS